MFFSTITCTQMSRDVHALARCVLNTHPHALLVLGKLVQLQLKLLKLLLLHLPLLRLVNRLFLGA